jgi:hypothetical protein
MVDGERRGPRRVDEGRLTMRHLKGDVVGGHTRHLPARRWQKHRADSAGSTTAIPAAGTSCSRWRRPHLDRVLSRPGGMERVACRESGSSSDQRRRLR